MSRSYFCAYLVVRMHVSLPTLIFSTLLSDVSAVRLSGTTDFTSAKWGRVPDRPLLSLEPHRLECVEVK